VQGLARVGFQLAGGATRLKDLYNRDPLRLLFPAPGPGEPPHAVLVTTSGGLVGGDSLEIEAAMEEGAQALLMPQAAEKIYGSTGADCRIRVRLTAANDGWLEWLPQETILFEGARLDRLTRIDAAPGASLLAGEMLVFGRIARGERLSRGLVRDAWEVRRGGRLVWADALHMEGDLASVIDDPACFDGAVAYATAIYVGEDAGERIDAARNLLERDASGTLAGASLVNGVLVLRWLGADALDLRRAFGGFWAGFRAQIQGLPEQLPRLWNM
jgi:urease accessory protein